MRRMIVFAALAILFSCTSEGRARETLEVEGYTAIRITGWSSHCSSSDDTCTGFEALGPTGRHVHGVVGCGFDVGCSKGCTVRVVP